MALIAVMGLVFFAGGFILLWSLGSWVMGGGGFPGGSSGSSDSVGPGSAAAAISVAALPVKSDYTLAPLVDLRAFRDLSYVPVKGVYLTSYGAASPDKLNKLIGLADRTEINAFVIDVKDDSGYVTYNADVPLAQELGLVDSRIKDIDALIAKLREHNITPIARVVCFKDDNLAKKRPDLAVKSVKGGSWKDNKGFNFLNPYKHEVWEYLVEVAEDAARHGFREIQFDYVRFPTDGPISQARYPGEYSSREDCIAGFLAFAHQRLEKLGVWLSADVFGITVSPTSVKDSQTIGQNVEKMSQNVDILSPMVYPSHYSDGYYGIADPNRSPYEIVTAAMKDTKKRLAGTGAKGRPWLQDFSLHGVTYGISEVKKQITAAEEQGFNEWILWDPSLDYQEKALRPQEN
jgi:hypothetical protein